MKRKGTKRKGNSLLAKHPTPNFLYFPSSDADVDGALFSEENAFSGAN
jgi:hypothetical protein